MRDASPALTTVPVNDGAARGAFKLRSAVNPVLTIAPATYRLPLKDESALDTKKLPVKVGEALGAFSANELVIVVENDASLPSANANSFNVSNVPGALAISALISLRTYAVVAICVLLVPDAAVVAVGVPVKAGDSRGAFKFKELVNPVLFILPLINKLPLKDESEATVRLAFKDTSPTDVTVPVKDGAVRGALRAMSALNPVLFIVPPMYKLPLNELSYATLNPAFIETSPSDSTIPVNDGDAEYTTDANKFANSVLIIDPLTYRLALKDESEATRRPALRDTSPVLTTVPVNDGAARDALRARSALNPVLTIDPFTKRLALKDESNATLKPAFNDTSPVLTIMPVKDGAARGALRARALVNPVLTIDPFTNRLALNELSL